MHRVFRGVVFGKTIQLESDPKLADGESVEVELRPAGQPQQWGEGIRASAGALTNCPEMDEYLAELQDERKIDRRSQADS